MAQQGQRKPNMSLEDRRMAFGMLWGSLDKNNKRGLSFQAVADQIQKSPRSISALWTRTLDNMRDHLITEIQNQSAEQITPEADIFSKPLSSFPGYVFESNKRGNCGRKRDFSRVVLHEVTKDNVPLNQRGTYRSLAANISRALGRDISHMTVYRLLKKEAFFRRHTSSLKPTLTELNRLTRLNYALDQIDETTLNTATRNGEVKFLDMMDRVHIDEK